MGEGLEVPGEALVREWSVLAAQVPRQNGPLGWRAVFEQLGTLSQMMAHQEGILRDLWMGHLQTLGVEILAIFAPLWRGRERGCVPIQPVGVVSRSFLLARIVWLFGALISGEARVVMGVAFSEEDAPRVCLQLLLGVITRWYILEETGSFGQGG